MLTRELRAELSKDFCGKIRNIRICIYLCCRLGSNMESRQMQIWYLIVRFLPNPYYIDELRPKSGK